jgi:hypothetical protein
MNPRDVALMTTMAPSARTPGLTIPKKSSEHMNGHQLIHGNCLQGMHTQVDCRILHVVSCALLGEATYDLAHFSIMQLKGQTRSKCSPYGHCPSGNNLSGIGA